MRDPSFSSNIWKMYLLRLLKSFHLFGGVLIPFFADWGHLNYAQILILQSWFLVWIFVFQIPTGAFADYFGRKVSIALGCFVWATAALIYVSSPSFYVFMLGEFVFAFGSALVSGADQAIIYDSLKSGGGIKSSKSVFGRYSSMGMLGIMIASPLGSYLGSFDIRLPMALTAIPLFLAGLIALSLKEPPSLNRVKSARYLDVLRDGLKYFAKHGTLKVLAIDMAFVGAIAYFIIWFFQIILKNAGVPILYYGFVHAALVLTEIVVLNSFVFFEKLFGSKRNFLIASTLIPGIMFVVAGITTYLPLLILSILLIGGFGLTRSTLIQYYMNKHIPTAQRATILSAAVMISELATAIANPFAGMMADWNFNATLIFLGLAAIAWGMMTETQEHMLQD